MSVYLPPQHGAWAFLVLPLVLGAVVAPSTPLLLVLTLAWVAGYPWSYAALGLVRARRPQRFRRPLLVWSAVVIPASAILVVARPWLAWVGLAYLLLFAVNLQYARANNERALANDAVFAVECSAMVVVTWAVGEGTQTWTPPPLSSVPLHAWLLTLVCFLVLIGSTLHVKSLIRERRDPRYARGSQWFAIGCLALSIPIAFWWGWPSGAWLVVPFAALTIRAFLVPRHPMRPGGIGMIELGCFLLVALAALLASW